MAVVAPSGAHVAPSASQWRNRIVGHGEEDPSQLLANPRNWRIHPKAQQDALAGALDQVGWVQTVIVNNRTGHLVDGHLRAELAIARGERTLPVAYVDLSEEEEALVLASLDPIAGMAVTDTTALEALLAEISFDSQALEDALRALAPEPRGGLTDPDDVPAVPDEPYVHPGDLWLLGEHRLLCGDSSDDKCHDQLVIDRVSVILTDPPYGIDLDTDYSSITGSKNSMLRQQGRKLVDANTYTRVEGDDRPFDASFLRSRYAHVPEQFWFGANYYRRTLSAVDLDGSWLVWDKRPSGWNDAGAGIDDVIGSGFELLWSSAKHQQRVLRQQWSGFTARNTGMDRAHPTEKPVALLVDILERWGKGDGAVLDPFSGSGTTLIAAEMLGRRCYAIEIEPKYVQVAIERWQAFTGREAVLDGQARTGTDPDRVEAAPG